MMAHVAEAGEASGRVLLLIEEGVASVEMAARAASRFAAAFNAEIETIAVNQDFAERAGGINASALVSADEARPLVNGTLTRVAAVQSLLTMRQIRVIEQASWRYGVACRHTALAGDPIDRLSEVCVSRGPWNIVVLSSPTQASTASTISAILANVGGATGIVTAPARTQSEEGPVVIVVEDAERLPGHDASRGQAQEFVRPRASCTGGRQALRTWRSRSSCPPRHRQSRRRRHRALRTEPRPRRRAR